MFVDKNVENLSIGKFKRKREKSANDPCKQKESEVIETSNVVSPPAKVSFPWGRGSLRGVVQGIRVPGGQSLEPCSEAAVAIGSYPWGRGILREGESFRGPGGRGSPFRGGIGISLLSGNVAAQGSVRHVVRGQATFRGVNKVRTRGERKQKTVGTKPSSFFVETVLHACPKLLNSDYKRSLVISNLPTIMIQDSEDICNFIAEHTNVLVEKLFYKIASDKSGSLAAVCLFENGKDLQQIMDDLHGQIFHGHHLMVDRLHERNNEHITEYCIKVSNLSREASEEKLWKLFESSGKLGVIYLNRDKCEALVNFEDLDSVINALKFNGAHLDQIKIKVMRLDPRLSIEIRPSNDLETLLKDFNVSHIKYCIGNKRASLGGIVFFPDQETYSKALNLNGVDWNGQRLVVRPSCHIVYIANPDKTLKHEDILTVFGTAKIKFHARKCDVEELHFDSKSEADTALKASPVLIKNQSVKVWDSAYKIPSFSAQSEDVQVEVDGKDWPMSEEFVEEEIAAKEEDDVENEDDDKSEKYLGVDMVAQKKVNVIASQKQQPTATSCKRKKNNSSALKGKKTKSENRNK